MKTRTLMIAAMGVTIAGMVGLAHAQRMDVGKAEFDSSCATCHGTSGNGNGPMAGYLTGRLPDLTTLASRNNGVFPFAQVYDTIDGSRPLKSHGPREMPIWGSRYMGKAADHYADFYGPYDAEAFARGRVLALTEYLYRLQGK